jgi:hypothetical protein
LGDSAFGLKDTIIDVAHLEHFAQLKVAVSIVFSFFADG